MGRFAWVRSRDPDFACGRLNKNGQESTIPASDCPLQHFNNNANPAKSQYFLGK
jgi:hypothetical protein